MIKEDIRGVLKWSCHFESKGSYYILPFACNRLSFYTWSGMRVKSFFYTVFRKCDACHLFFQLVTDQVIMI